MSGDKKKDEKKPKTEPPKKKKPDELRDEQLDKVSGGFNPQPEPPGKTPGNIG